MAIGGISNLVPRDPQPPANRRPAAPDQAADEVASGGEAKADFKEVLAARLERVRVHAANMRTYTGRAKVQLDEAPAPVSSEIDVRV